MHGPLWYTLFAPVQLTSGLYERKARNLVNRWRRAPKAREEDVMGKVVAITGANSGIGKHTVIAMAKRGAVVVMGCRDLVTGELARKEIMAITESSNVELYKLNLSDLESVRKFATDVLEKHPVIGILINNDRVQRKTKEGWDLVMATNHLGHFLLANLFIHTILANEIRRVVSVSSTSSGLILATLKTSDLMLENCDDLGIWNMKGYQNSKLAMSLFTKLLEKRYASVKTNSVCPGCVMSEIFRHSPKRSAFVLWMRFWGAIYFQKVEFGVDGILLCALAKKMEKDSGGFFRFGKQEKRIEKILGNEELAEAVWIASKKHCGSNELLQVCCLIPEHTKSQFVITWALDAKRNLLFQNPTKCIGRLEHIFGWTETELEVLCKLSLEEDEDGGGVGTFQF